MKAFLILEDGTVFEGTSIGSTKDMISEIVFNTSMTGYLEVLTDPSYTGYGVQEGVAGWLYCKRIVQNAKQLPL